MPISSLLRAFYASLNNARRALHLVLLGLCFISSGPVYGVYQLKDGVQVSFTQRGADVWTACVVDGFQRVEELPVVSKPGGSVKATLAELAAQPKLQAPYRIHIRERRSVSGTERMVYLGALGIRGGMDNPRHASEPQRTARSRVDRVQHHRAATPHSPAGNWLGSSSLPPRRGVPNRDPRPISAVNPHSGRSFWPGLEDIFLRHTARPPASRGMAGGWLGSSPVPPQRRVPASSPRLRPEIGDYLPGSTWTSTEDILSSYGYGHSLPPMRSTASTPTPADGRRSNSPIRPGVRDVPLSQDSALRSTRATSGTPMANIPPSLLEELLKWSTMSPTPLRSGPLLTRPTANPTELNPDLVPNYHDPFRPTPLTPSMERALEAELQQLRRDRHRVSSQRPSARHNEQPSPTTSTPSTSAEQTEDTEQLGEVEDTTKSAEDTKLSAAVQKLVLTVNSSLEEVGDTKPSAAIQESVLTVDSSLEEVESAVQAFLEEAHDITPQQGEALLQALEKCKVQSKESYRKQVETFITEDIDPTAWALVFEERNATKSKTTQLRKLRSTLIETLQPSDKALQAAGVEAAHNGQGGFTYYSSDEDEQPLSREETQRRRGNLKTVAKEVAYYAINPEGRALQAVGKAIGLAKKSKAATTVVTKGIVQVTRKGTTSINQLEMLVKRGQAPRSIRGFHPAYAKHTPMPHVHFTDGSSLYIDGTWRHRYKELSNAEINFLRIHGWNVNTR